MFHHELLCSLTILHFAIAMLSKKIRSVAYDIIKDDLNELLTQELNDDGYSGIEVKVTLTRAEIIMLATRIQNVLGKVSSQCIRALTTVVPEEFDFP